MTSKLMRSAARGRRLLGSVIAVLAIWNFVLMQSLHHLQRKFQDYSALSIPKLLTDPVFSTDSSSSSSLLGNAITKIKARNAYLYPENTDKSQWGWKTGGPKRFQEVDVKTTQVISMALQPYYSCPWTLHRTNFVSETVPKPQFDGGKWTCGLEEISQCIIYSFGSNGDDFFENSVKNINEKCEIHIFDPTSGDPPSHWQGKYHFHKVGLCAGDTTFFSLDGTNTKTKAKVAKTYPCKSIKNHMKDLNHTHVDILKADVEGMEWELLKDFDLTNVGQLLLEFHFWHPSSPSHLPELLRQFIIPLERFGYFIHTLEPVGAQIDAYEITFLNVNWSPTSVFGSTTKVYDASMYPITPNVVL